MTLDENGVVAANSYNAGYSSLFHQGIELRTGNGAPTYIDFSNTAFNNPEFDYDMRLILANDDTLIIRGGNVVVEDGVVQARSFNQPSDKDLKRNFVPVDTEQVVSKLADLSIQMWTFKGENPDIRHIGPTAQDFQAAFGLGDSDRHISTVDADGIALAAIQGLYRLVMEKDERIAVLETALEAVNRRLDAIDRAATKR